MDLDATYALFDVNGAKTETSKALVKFNDTAFSISPDSGTPLLFSLRDISSIEPKDYQVHLSVSTGERIVLSDLGYKFEDFIRLLTKAFNELTLEDLLVSEHAQSLAPDAAFSFAAAKGGSVSGKCSLRLYDTSLAMLPDKGGVKVFPFREIAEIKQADYIVFIARENGDTLSLSEMGHKFEPFCAALTKAMNGMFIRTQALLKEIDPALGPLLLRKLAQAIKEGKAVSKREIDSLAPSLWAGLEKKLCSDTDFKANYEFLKGLSRPDRICFGFKRGVAMAGDYMFVLVPLHGDASRGNAIAFETVSLSAGQPGKEDSRATYFFRLTGKEAYETLKSPQERDAAADVFIKVFNTCMSAINFRRAPVFLTDEQLSQPRYEKYRIASHIIPELVILRKLFIGRVIHSDNWKGRVAELLKYNAQNGAARWLGADAESDFEEKIVPETAPGG